MSLEESRLYQDLYLDHRDAMYRAMSFIERHGGPMVTGDTKEILVNNRGRAHHWLCAQPNSIDLSEEYERFLKNWSPVFLE